MLSNKTLIIIISVLILLAGGVLIYYYYFQDSEPVVEETTTQPTAGGSVSVSRIKKISQEPVMGVNVDNQKVRYYLKSNGNVLESDFDGNNTNILSSYILPNLLKVNWSPSGNKVVALFEENQKARNYSYDYLTGESSPLNEGIGWTAWSPDQDKITYQYYNQLTGENKISISDFNGSNWQDIYFTKMKNLIVEWPKNDIISIRTRSSGLAQSIVYLINLSDSSPEKIIGETFGLTVLYSPLGDKIIFSETDEKGKDLKLKKIDLNSRLTKELNFVTLPEKCAWSQDNRTIFCAVPKDISTYAVLPDDYYKKAVSFSDDFWRVNLETGEKTQIYKAEKEEAAAYNASDLILSPLEDYLIFINQGDDTLYSLKL
ncbi:MAG: hypothetical protein ABH889_01090 [Candidatus Portnoybacteria bacterium]